MTALYEGLRERNYIRFFYILLFTQQKNIANYFNDIYYFLQYFCGTDMSFLFRTHTRSTHLSLSAFSSDLQSAAQLVSIFMHI